MGIFASLLWTVNIKYEDKKKIPTNSNISVDGHQSEGVHDIDDTMI